MMTEIKTIGRGQKDALLTKKFEKKIWIELYIYIFCSFKEPVIGVTKSIHLFTVCDEEKNSNKVLNPPAS